MNRRTRWLLGGLAIAAGAISAAGTFWKRKQIVEAPKKVGGVWARPGMPVTFRGELMPGRSRQERTFLVKELLWNGRVLLHGVDGEHAEREFEPIQIDRPAT